MIARPPCSAKRRAVARPMPRSEAAPVMMQTFSDSSIWSPSGVTPQFDNESAPRRHALGPHLGHFLIARDAISRPKLGQTQCLQAPLNWTHPLPKACVVTGVAVSSVRDRARGKPILPDEKRRYRETPRLAARSCRERG